MAALKPRDIIQGNPPSPINQPIPALLVDWMQEQESLAAGGGLSYVDGTVAALQARIGTADGEFGLVLSAASEAGVYERVSGVWTKVASIPAIFTESLAAIEATASAAAALVSQNESADSETNAATSASTAATEADNASIAALAAGAAIYSDTTVGLAATSNDDLFFVPAAGILKLYENQSGVAVEQVSTPLINRREPVDYSALIADTSLTYVLGKAGTVEAGDPVKTQKESFRYTAAASGAADHHVETAGGVKLKALPDAHGAISLAALGLTVSTTDIQPLLIKAATIAKKIIVPFNVAAYTMTSQWVGSDVELVFEPGARISFDLVTGGMDLFGVTLRNAHFTSPYSLTLDNYTASITHASDGREVRLGPDCVVDGYYHEFATRGINVTAGYNISLRNIKCRNLRHYKGWGAAVHVSGVGSYNIRGDGFDFEGCDRGCEVESGARSVWLDNGRQKDTGPNGYTGQPGDYAPYTFVLDVHSHDGEGACINVNYRNWEIVNCQAAISCVRSNGTDGNDLPRSCSWRDIRITGRVGTASYPSVFIQGINCHAKHISLGTGGGITSQHRVVFGPASEGCSVEELYASSYALPLITDEATNYGTKIGKIVPENPDVGSGYLIDIAGANATIDGPTLLSIGGATLTGLVRFQSTADRGRIKSLDYYVATTDTPAENIVVDGAGDVQITGVIGSNFASSPPIDIKLTGAAARCNIQANNLNRAAGTAIDLGASTQRCLVTGNVIATSTATIDDVGTDNTIIHDQRGNVFA